MGLASSSSGRPFADIGHSRSREWDWPRLRAVALRETSRILDQDSAQDAAQEAVLRAWRHAASCSGTNPEPWVKMIARREALRIAARRPPEQYRSRDVEGAEENDEPLQAIDRVDVARAMAGLSRDEQEALLLHYWAGKSDTEIATMLQTPVGTIKVRLHRARRKLKPGLMAS